MERLPEGAARKQELALARLQESEERYRRLLGRIQDGVVIIQEGRLRFQGTLEGLHGQMEAQLVLGVDQPARARHLLERAGWTVHGNGGHRLTVAANGQSDAAMINAQLVREGLNVYDVSVERPTLEDIFLTLTQGSVLE